MAAAAAGLQLLGTAGSTYAQVKAADTEARVKQAEARAVEGSTQLEEIQQRRRAAIATGQANAIAAASGLDLTSGTPLLMELDRAKQSEIEAQSIRRTGAMQASGLRFQSALAKKSIPWTIIGGAAQGGSILSQYKAGTM